MDFPIIIPNLPGLSGGEMRVFSTAWGPPGGARARPVALGGGSGASLGAGGRGGPMSMTHKDPSRVSNSL